MQGHRRGLPVRGSLALLAFAALVLIPGAGAMTMSNGSNGGLPELRVLSNRADLISGGDALVQVVLPGTRRSGAVHGQLDGTDMTSAFAVRSDGRFDGLVTGLANGANDLRRDARRARPSRLTITNHPIGGPVFAGPQMQPWVCTTRRRARPGADRRAVRRAAGRLRSYMNAVTGSSSLRPGEPAAGVDRDHDDRPGQDRALHRPRGVRREGPRHLRVAVLANPAPWAPWAPQRGWNHKLLYQFGGCTAPGTPAVAPTSVLDDIALSRGFMVANIDAQRQRQRTRTTTSRPRR